MFNMIILITTTVLILVGLILFWMVFLMFVGLSYIHWKTFAFAKISNIYFLHSMNSTCSKFSFILDAIFCLSNYTTRLQKILNTKETIVLFIDVDMFWSFMNICSFYLCRIIHCHSYTSSENNKGFCNYYSYIETA